MLIDNARRAGRSFAMITAIHGSATAATGLDTVLGTTVPDSAVPDSPVPDSAVPDTTVLDTTGAGDALAAGTLAGWLAGVPGPQAVAAGAALAARVVGRLGARPGPADTPLGPSPARG